MKLYKKVPVHVAGVRHAQAEMRNAVRVEARPSKITHTRSELGDGQYMVTYYFRKGQYGEYIAEDYRNATHFERAVYDEQNNFIGSTIGTINEKVKW